MSLSHMTVRADVLAQVFVFFVEVIAHGKQAAAALPSSGMSGADPGGLVPSPQA